jgi:hypothetical protein
MEDNKIGTIESKENTTETIEKPSESSSSLFPSHEEIMRSVIGDNDKSNYESEHKEEEALKQFKEEPKRTEYSDIEKEAMQQGWVPKEKFVGDSDNWKSAKDYVEYGKVIEKKKEEKHYQIQSREISELKKMVKEFSDIAKGQAKFIAEEKVKDVLQKKRDAIIAGDVEGAESYEEEYSRVKQEVNSYKDQSVSPPAPQQEALDFIENNKDWFNSNTTENSTMMDYAIKTEASLEKQHPDWTIDQRLDETENCVRRFFPNNFQKQEVTRPSAVESRSQVRLDPSRITYNDLPEDARQIVNTFAKSGVLSRDEYTRQLILTGAIKL